jgi:hypothetical protein
MLVLRVSESQETSSGKDDILDFAANSIVVIF